MDWLVVLGLTALLDSISVYIGPSPRERGRKKREVIDERKKMSKQPLPAPTASTVGPCPTTIQISWKPRHWKFTQQLRTTRPPHGHMDALHIVPYLGHSATKDRVTFHISQLQLQIKVGFQLSVQFVLQFESSEGVAWG